MINEWDKYFLNLCNAVATNSKCLSRHLGSAIVRDKFIVSTGYNGPPSNCIHCDNKKYQENLKEAIRRENESSFFIIGETKKECPRRAAGFKSGQGLEYCQASHAERNAIYTAVRFGHPVEGCTLYLNWLIPCAECAKAIINSGIKEVVVTELKDYESRGITGRYLLAQSGVSLRAYHI